MNKKDLLIADEDIKRRIRNHYKNIMAISLMNKDEIVYTFICSISKYEEPVEVEIGVEYRLLSFFYMKEYVDMVLDNMEKELQYQLLRRFKQ